MTPDCGFGQSSSSVLHAGKANSKGQKEGAAKGSGGQFRSAHLPTLNVDVSPTVDGLETSLDVA